MTDLIPHQVCSLSPERGEGAENPPSTPGGQGSPTVSSQKHFEDFFN